MEVATVCGLLKARAERTPHATAFVVLEDEPPRHVSWAEFDAQVQAMAEELLVYGARPRQPIGILAANSLSWEVAHHALLKIGAVAVGLDCNDTPSCITQKAAQVGLRHVIGSPAQLSRKLPDLCRTTLAATGDLLIAPMTTTSPASTEGHGHVSDAGPADAGPGPGDIATVVFTSGTTGRPKALAYTHQQLCAAVQEICTRLELRQAGARLACWLPLANLFQRIANLTMLASGGSSYLIADPRHVMQCLPLIEPDMFIGVPRFYEKLHGELLARLRHSWIGRRALAALARVRQQWQHRAPVRIGPLEHLLLELVARVVNRKLKRVFGRRLRYVVSGSAALRADVLHDLRFFGLPLLEAYGTSETAIPIAMNAPHDYRLGSVGRPLSTHEVKLGNSGEVMVRSSGRAFSWSSDEARSPGELPSGWLATGDLGHFDADGYLYLTGRCRDVFKLSTGCKVAPVQLESRLNQHPEVEHCVVFGARRRRASAVLNIGSQHWQRRVQQAGTVGAAKATLMDELQPLLTLVPRNLHPENLVVVEEPFTVEGGELTPNLKLRRQQIIDKYVPTNWDPQPLPEVGYGSAVGPHSDVRAVPSN